MEYTPILHLPKQDADDIVDVVPLNDSMDILESELLATVTSAEKNSRGDLILKNREGEEIANIPLNAGIASITSAADANGDTVVTVTLTSGASSNFTVPKGDTGPPGSPGAAGQDGASARVDSIFKTGKITTITITDANGVHVANISDGETGAKGDPFKITKTYASIAEMEADFNNTDIPEGSFIAISSNVNDPDNAKLFLKGASSYSFITDLSGADGIKGDDGISPTLSVSKSNGITTIQFTDITGGQTATIQDGITPVRGTDYWTAADQAAIVAAVLAEIDDGDTVEY